MKKTIFILSWFLCVFVFAGCGTADDKQASDTRVADAITAITEQWNNEYTENNIEDKYLKIVNTRIINIKENNTEAFKDIDYIVEFVLFSNYFGAAPYYQNVGIYDSVVVYRDGSKEVPQRNRIDVYRAKSYSSDFSAFIKSIEDFNEEYNQIVEIK